MMSPVLIRYVVLFAVMMAICSSSTLHVRVKKSSSQQHAMASQERPVKALSQQPDIATQFINCTSNLKTHTWDGKAVQICDPAICMGAQKLAILDKPQPGDKAELRQRGPESSWSDFLDAVSNAEGWLVSEHVWLVKALSEHQHGAGLLGAVGEIGVHHGKFWAPIVAASLACEPAVAIDLFEDQAKNFDRSGKGSKDAFLRLAKSQLGLQEDAIELFAGDSMGLTCQQFAARGLPRFRLFSVDGGHSLETTAHDMTLAACLLANGGIMIVDDVVMYPEESERFPWAGVPSAVFPWVLAQARFAPFLWAHNKVYLTTVTHHERLLAAVSEHPAVKCAHTLADIHASRYAIGPHLVCINMKRALPQEELLQAMLSDE